MLIKCNGFAGSLDRFGGHNQDSQTLGEPKLLLGQHRFTPLYGLSSRSLWHQGGSGQMILWPDCRYWVFKARPKQSYHLVQTCCVDLPTLHTHVMTDTCCWSGADVLRLADVAYPHDDGKICQLSQSNDAVDAYSPSWCIMQAGCTSCRPVETHTMFAGLTNCSILRAWCPQMLFDAVLTSLVESVKTIAEVLQSIQATSSDTFDNIFAPSISELSQHNSLMTNICRQAYSAEDRPRQDQLWCMVLGRYLDRNMITASYIYKRRWPVTYAVSPRILHEAEMLCLPSMGCSLNHTLHLIVCPWCRQTCTWK